MARAHATLAALRRVPTSRHTNHFYGKTDSGVTSAAMRACQLLVYSLSVTSPNFRIKYPKNSDSNNQEMRKLCHFWTKIGSCCFYFSLRNLSLDLMELTSLRRTLNRAAKACRRQILVMIVPLIIPSMAIIMISVDHAWPLCSPRIWS